MCVGFVADEVAPLSPKSHAYRLPFTERLLNVTESGLPLDTSYTNCASGDRRTGKERVRVALQPEAVVAVPSPKAKTGLPGQ